MTPELQAAIEHYLLHDPGDDGWFRGAQIAARFGLPDDRFLRAEGSHPGPLSRCTIFSGRGVKHIVRATPDEIQRCKERIRKELVSRVFRRRWLREGLARHIRTTPSPATESASGQTLLFT